MVNDSRQIAGQVMAGVDLARSVENLAGQSAESLADQTAPGPPPKKLVEIRQIASEADGLFYNARRGSVAYVLCPAVVRVSHKAWV